MRRADIYCVFLDLVYFLYILDISIIMGCISSSLGGMGPVRVPVPPPKQQSLKEIFLMHRDSLVFPPFPLLP
jgi:hypothetical protein